MAQRRALSYEQPIWIANYQLSIINCQFAAPQHCHATPKINFFHLETIHFATSEIAIVQFYT